MGYPLRRYQGPPSDDQIIPPFAGISCSGVDLAWVKGGESVPASNPPSNVRRTLAAGGILRSGQKNLRLHNVHRHNCQQGQGGLEFRRINHIRSTACASTIGEQPAYPITIIETSHKICET